MTTTLTKLVEAERQHHRETMVIPPPSCPICCDRPPEPRNKYCHRCHTAISAAFVPQAAALRREIEVSVARDVRYWSLDAQHERAVAQREQWFRSLGISPQWSTEEALEIAGRGILGDRYRTPEQRRASNHARYATRKTISDTK